MIFIDQAISRDVHLTALQGFPDNEMLSAYFSYCSYTGGPSIPAFGVPLTFTVVFSMMVAIIVVKRKKFVE
jgi:hypothetical protein